MKIKKHKVAIYKGDCCINQLYYKKKEKALEIVELYKDGFFGAQYKGTVEIDFCCEYCDKDLNPGDEYLKVDEHTRYCSDCYEEESFTCYTVGGDQVADENDGEIYDEWDTEAEVYEK